MPTYLTAIIGIGLSVFTAGGSIQGDPVVSLASPSGELRVPGEFERQEAIVIAADGLAGEYPDLFLNLVAVASSRAKVALMIGDSRQGEFISQILKEREVDSSRVVILPVPHDTIWVRDYGPVFVKDSTGKLWAVDSTYGYCDRENDELVPERLAPVFGTGLLRAGLELDGGNLLSNGEGLILTTRAILEQDDGERQKETDVRRLLRTYFGARQVVLLEPLEGESSGHVDMFAMFTSPDTVLIGSYDPLEDPINARILDLNAQRLKELRTPGGHLRVIRIPMPPHEDDIWRTYTNSMFVNGALLVPRYEGVPEEVHGAAMEILRRVLPLWQIVPIDASDIIQSGGAIHCISMQVPAVNRSADTSVAPDSMHLSREGAHKLKMVHR